MISNAEDTESSFRKEFESVFGEHAVILPKLPLLIIVIAAILIAPTYPTEKTSYHWSAFGGGGGRVSNFDLQPPLVILLNGFEWEDDFLFFGSIDSGIASSHRAPSWPMAVYAIVILLICFVFILSRRNGKQIIVEETNAQFFLAIFGFSLLAVGLLLSVGILFAGIFGIPFRLVPINGGFDLWMLFLVVAPAFLFTSFLLLKKVKNLKQSPAGIESISLNQRIFPRAFSVLIILFVIGSFTLQAIIPQTEPVIIQGIDVLPIIGIVNNTNDVQIEFGMPNPGNYAGNLEILLTSIHHTVSICWPDTVAGSNITMPCTVENVTAYYISQSTLDSPVISSGDTLVIYNLYKNESYLIRVYNIASDSLTSIIGPDTFTTGGDNYG